MRVLPYCVPMTAVLVLVGLVLVAAVLVDMFHTLWHPRGFGTGARIVFKTTWRAFKLLPARVDRNGLAGPLGLFFTAVLWTTTLVLGFALVYLPFIPDGFNYGSSLNVGRSSSFLTAVYVSLVALATLGLGDIVPSEPALRVLVPLQALVGFALLTGAISWVLQLYPALTRRRAVARRLHSLAEVDTADKLSQLEPSVAVMILEDVRADLATIEMDLLQYGESYYFREDQREISLAATLPYAHDLIAGARRSEAPETVLAAELLGSGLQRLTELLARDFLSHADQPDVLGAFGADHGQDPLRAS